MIPLVGITLLRRVGRWPYVFVLFKWAPGDEVFPSRMVGLN